MPELVIVINREVPSVNKTMYKHWRAYTKERDHWMLLLRVLLRPRPKPTTPMRAIIHSLRGRMIDFGNYVGGCKPIPDCLVRLGYLHDDSPQWFDCTYIQERAPAELRCTRIKLWAAV